MNGDRLRPSSVRGRKVIRKGGGERDQRSRLAWTPAQPLSCVQQQRLQGKSGIWIQHHAFLKALAGVDHRHDLTNVGTLNQSRNCRCMANVRQGLHLDASGHQHGISQHRANHVQSPLESVSGQVSASGRTRCGLRTLVSLRAAAGGRLSQPRAELLDERRRVRRGALTQRKRKYCHEINNLYLCGVTQRPRQHHRPLRQGRRRSGVVRGLAVRNQ